MTASGAAPATVESKTPVRVAVLPLRALGVAKDAARALETTLRNEAAALPEVRVIDDVDVNAQLQREVDCLARPTCAQAAAARAGAQRVVLGTVSELGDAYLLDLKLLDTRGGSEVRRVTRPVSGRSELLIEVVRGAITELLVPERFVGRLRVRLATPAQLFVDGKSAPAGEVLDHLAPGQHAVRAGEANVFVEVRFDRTTDAVVDPLTGTLTSVTSLRAGDPLPVERAPAPAVLAAQPAPLPPRAPWLKIGGWSGVAVGGVALVAAVGFHAKAYSAASQINARADANQLKPSDLGAYSDVDRATHTARALYVVGGLLAAAGVTLLVIDRRF